MAIDTGYQEQGAIHHAKQVVEEARAFRDSLGHSVGQFTESVDLRGRVERNPIAMCLAAAGVGYLLGGGLFSPFTSRLFKVGLRLAIIPLVKSQLSALAGKAAQPGEGAAGSTF